MGVNEHDILSNIVLRQIHFTVTVYIIYVYMLGFHVAHLCPLLIIFES